MKTPIHLKKVAKGEDIGEELHPGTDEFISIVEGKGEIKINTNTYPVDEHFSMFIPAGTRHDIINTGKEELKLVSVYAPPLHVEGLVVETREKAFAAEKR